MYFHGTSIQKYIPMILTHLMYKKQIPEEVMLIKKSED